jgi:two-component system, NtrC family, sensor kinase
MPDGGTLNLRSFDTNRDGLDGIAIEVGDTGIGMDADVVARVFDPFFTTKRRGGTGLGLSISQTLIKRQRGEISVESRIGAGSTFSVWLPEAS